MEAENFPLDGDWEISLHRGRWEDIACGPLDVISDLWPDPDDVLEAKEIAVACGFVEMGEIPYKLTAKYVGPRLESKQVIELKTC